jgi:hypothetical protein
MDLRGITCGGVEPIHLSHDIVYWQVFVGKVMNLWFPCKAFNFRINQAIGNLPVNYVPSVVVKISVLWS